jgi:hypothetical protein
MISYTMCLIDLLSTTGKPAGNKINALSAGVRGIFQNVSQCIFKTIGWLRDDVQTTGNKPVKNDKLLLLIVNLVIARYENLVLCRSNIPFMKFMFALILWDFAPSITPQLCMIVLDWLKKSRVETEKLIPDNIAVYHMIRGNIRADEFILHIQDTIDIIHRHVTEDDLRQRKDSPVLRAKLRKLSNIKLMLLELDRPDA